MALTKIDDRGLKTPIDLLDNEKIRFGTGNDLELYHDGSHSYIKDTGTGNLRLLTSSVFTVNNAANSENMILATDGGSVELYYDGSKKLNTFANGITVTGTLYATEAVYVGDSSDSGTSDYIAVGTGKDLKLFHDGTDSYIDSSTGNLQLTCNEFRVKSKSGGEAHIQSSDESNVQLYYDGVKKLETTTYGVNIAGASGSFSTASRALVVGDGASGSWHGISIFTNSDSGGSLNFVDSNGDTSVGLIQYRHNETNPFFRIAVEGNDAVKIHSDNSQHDVELVNGNLVVASGHGIDFSATGTPLSGSSSNSELFEDYERGSWTMGFEYYNTTTSAWTTVPFDNSPDYSSFDYVKCGHLVHVWGYTGGFNVGSAAVNMSARLTGLPYAAVWSQPYYGASCIFTHTSAFGSSGNVEYVATGYTPYNLAVLYPMRPKTDQIACWIDGDKTFMFSATYETAS